jgi:hypothetical protein
MTLRRYGRLLKIDVTWPTVVVAGALFAATLVTLGTWAVSARIERDAATRRACEARVEALKSRNAYLLSRRDVGEPCSYLRLVNGDQP